MVKFKDFDVIGVGGAPGGDCFLLRYNVTTLCDTGFSFAAETTCAKLAEVLGGDDLTNILLTHAHYDHAGGAMRVKEAHPEATLFCNDITAGIFARPGAIKVMRELDASACK